MERRQLAGHLSMPLVVLVVECLWVKSQRQRRQHDADLLLYLGCFLSCYPRRQQRLQPRGELVKPQ